MSEPTAVRDVSLHVLLHFLARRLVLALPEQESPPFLGPLLHRLILSSLAIPPLVHSPHRLVPTVILQEPASSSQSCRSRSSPAQPLKTRHILRVSWSLHPQVKQPHVALSTEICDLLLLVVLDEGLVLRRRRFTGQTSQTILRLCPSSVGPVTDLSPRARMGSSPRASEDLSCL